MTQLLLRLFVRNYTDTGSPEVRTACGWLAGWVGIVVNVLLFLGKLIAGVLTGSVSITADAVNNLSDASGRFFGRGGSGSAGFHRVQAVSGAV